MCILTERSPVPVPGGPGGPGGPLGPGWPSPASPWNDSETPNYSNTSRLLCVYNKVLMFCTFWPLAPGVPELPGAPRGPAGPWNPEQIKPIYPVKTVVFKNKVTHSFSIFSWIPLKKTNHSVTQLFSILYVELFQPLSTYRLSILPCSTIWSRWSWWARGPGHLVHSRTICKLEHLSCRSWWTSGPWGALGTTFTFFARISEARITLVKKTKNDF